jgi:5-methylcytosine-specific restriction endonuclease McrA
VNVEMNPAKCAHPVRAVRHRPCADGSDQFWDQCLDCGAAVGAPISRAAACAQGRKPEAFDELIRERGKRLQRKEQVESEEARKVFLIKWKIWYDEYLASPEWREKRAKVLKRDGGVCQACLDRSATQVHHQTYAHVGAELLFELISLCDDCHARAHAGGTEGTRLRAAWKRYSGGAE